MSTKSTILLMRCCHIYTDHIGSNGKETLCIEVNHGDIEGLDCIEVEYDSEFAKLMLILLQGKTESELLAIIKGMK